MRLRCLTFILTRSLTLVFFIYSKCIYAGVDENHQNEEMDQAIQGFKNRFTNYSTFQLPPTNFPSIFSEEVSIQSRPRRCPEIWRDFSDGNTAALREVMESPHFSALFKVSPKVIFGESDSLNAAPIFIYGDSSWRTPKNCFIIGLHREAKLKLRKKLTSLLKIFNGTTDIEIDKVLNGCMTCFPAKTLPLKILEKIKWLKIVERDSIIKKTQIEDNAPWGLSRLSTPALPISGKFGFKYTGKGVTIFVMDSGVTTSHQEFGGRASIVKSFYKDKDEDCAGHGTETSSVIAGTTVGVAKLATIKAIKVLDCDGNGRNSDLIRALDYVMHKHSGPTIINMSLGGSNQSIALDHAISATVGMGIPIICAAGNEATDACHKSPAGNPNVLTVGASTERDARSKYSNYGKCVSVFAPGDSIEAASNSGNDAYSYPSGTSMSTPFVTGVVAQIMEQDPYQNVKLIYKRLERLCVSGKLKANTLKGSPNLLVQAMPYDPNDPTQYVDLNPKSSSLASADPAIPLLVINFFLVTICCLL